MRNRSLNVLGAVCALFLWPLTSSAAFDSGLINFEYNDWDQFGAIVGTYGPGPAVIGASDSIWNNGHPYYDAVKSLVNDRGELTDVDFGWTFVSSFGPNVSGPYANLLTQFVGYTDQPHGAAILGLTPNKAYDLYLYGSPHGLSLSVEGVPFQTSSYSGTVNSLVQGVHYDVHTVMSDATGKITMSHQGGKVDLAALQITPHIPEPSGFAMAIGLSVILAFSRNARARTVARVADKLSCRPDGITAL